MTKGSRSCRTNKTNTPADITSNQAKTLYPSVHNRWSIAAETKGMISPESCSSDIMCQISLPKLFSSSKTLRLSSKKACQVPLQKLRYNAAHIHATTNHRREGKRKRLTAHTTLHTTAVSSDFFLPVVSARTDVGSSKSHMRMVEMFDKITISHKRSPL
jgi:hypothetical protein